MVFPALPTALLDSCAQHLHQHLGVSPQERILVAVSGGMDSVLLCHILHQLGQPIEVAHCNFQLRGDASDEDAAWVGRLAHALQVPYHEVRFDTLHSAKAWGVSIQVAARELRYGWLGDLRRMQHCAYIATGHHLDDGIETALFQWVRGCGVRGLHGIPALTDTIVRPLMHLERATIRQTVTALNLAYREDASNASDKYTRNKLRHHVVPTLRDINPSLGATMQANFARMQQAERVLDWAAAFWKKQLWDEQAGLIRIKADAWDAVPDPEWIVWTWLAPLGFSAGQVRDMLASTGQAAGRTFASNTHELLVDRTHWLLRPQQPAASMMQRIQLLDWPDSPWIPLPHGQQLTWQILPALEWKPAASPWVMAMDADRVAWPLVIRPWEQGDKIAPLGMGGQRKKVSQLLKNAKYSLYEKERVCVLCWGKEVAWVIGLRMSEAFKVTPDTHRVLVMTVTP